MCVCVCVCVCVCATLTKNHVINKLRSCSRRFFYLSVNCNCNHKLKQKRCEIFSFKSRKFGLHKLFFKQSGLMFC